jgi:hypothetical protein
LLTELAVLPATEVKTFKFNPNPVTPSALGFKPVQVHLIGRPLVQTLKLDGLWLFHPAEGALAPQALDAEARRIVAEAGGEAGFAQPGKWHPLAVPQFLNRYAWWLDISKKFVQADKARLAALPFDAEKTQAGWYRQQIELPKIAGPLPEVVVNFEGVAMLSRVYCNGHYVGGHVGMFGQFECRLTPHLNWGTTNTLLVYAERGSDVKGADEVVSVAVTVPVTRGMLASLNHGMFGGFGRGAFAKFLGIWQPVTLKVSQPGGRIADAFFKPALDGHAIDIAVQNPGTQAVTGQLHYQVRDRQSGTLLHAEAMAKPLEIVGETTRAITLVKHGLVPKLWSPDFPNLYDLVIEWKSADGLRLLDRWTHPVGYRTVEVKGTQLHLNGHPYWTRGAGMPVYGYKPNDEITARGFLRQMHAGNQVVTRSGCNPWNKLWFGAADEEGVGVANEGVRPWALMSKQAPPAPAILAQWKTEQVETVRQYRNHPSILFYCVANEGLQGDHENPEKLAIYRDIITTMRQADPTRPICQTSGEPDAAGNADIEDVHSYWGWYEHSSFVFDYDTPRRGLHAGDGRAFINKETAVPYQDTDTGGVHPNYVGRYSAHPWVGELGAEGDEPAYFAEHVRAEAKLKTEKLRRQRQSLPTAGMILFANTTWIGNVLTAQPDQWKFFPVWEGARQALEPVLVGWTTTRHVFFAGDTVQTRVFVVNDDARFRDLKVLTLKAEVLDASGRSLVAAEQPLGAMAYFTARDWPLELKIPAPEGCDQALTAATVRLTLSDSSDAVATNRYPIRIAARPWAIQGGSSLTVATEGCTPSILAHLRAMGTRLVTVAEARAGGMKCEAVILGPQAASMSEAMASALLKPGGRLLALQQGAAARRFCPEVYPPQRMLAWGEPKGYELRSQGLRAGTRWATDRDLTFTEIPARLAGAAQIVTRMGDKASDPAQPLLRFRLPTGGRVLVAYDSRATALPGWLQDWTKTGEALGVSTGFQLNLFEKTFTPGEVVLSGNRGPGVTAMYTVAVLPDKGGSVEQLELASQGEGKVGADNALDHFMFEKADSAVGSTVRVNGEFVEMLGWKEGRPLFTGLDAMDWKWWARGEGQPAFACTATHRIDVTRKEVIPLGRFLESHFYWSGNLKKIYESKLTWPVFAVRRSWGTLVVCELALSDAMAHDPRAARTLSNLLTQAMDTNPRQQPE